MLASLDGAIGPLAETRIPVTDEGLLRGDGGFEVARLYGGRPFAMDDHYARLQRTCNGLRLEFDLTALRAEVDALLEEAGPIEGLLRIVLTRGGRRLAMIEPLPHRLAGRARDDRRPTRPTAMLDGLKTLSYAGQHARRAPGQGAGLRRGAVRHAARPRARGPDVDLLLGRRRAAADAAAGGPHPRLDHARPRDRGVRRRGGGLHARRRARRRGGVHRLQRARGACRSPPSTTSSCRARRGRSRRTPASASRGGSSGSWGRRPSSSTDAQPGRRSPGTPRTRARGRRRRGRS